MRICLLFCCALALASAVRNEYQDPQCGDRQVMVQLFEWKWSDIALECELFLGPRGYCAVQVSPPNEHVVVDNPPRPWWQRYQPVSYVIESRSGNQWEFQDMVDRCRHVGVRVIVDVVLNNMASTGRQGEGTVGTPYDADLLLFPGVPYFEDDFNNASLCNSNDTTYSDVEKMRNCPQFGMTDLDQSREHVQDAMAEFLGGLLQMGVSGFRVNGAKFMWPQDLRAIQEKVNERSGGIKPFYLLDVYDTGSDDVTAREYADLGYVTEYRYAQRVAEGVKDFTKFWEVVNYAAGMVDTDQAFVFVDTPATQRFVPSTLTFKHPREYIMATAFTLAYGYGSAQVMSSFEFDDYNQGPPSNAGYSTRSVGISKDGYCQGGWVCEHRWRDIFKLVPFSNAVAGKDVNHVNANQDVVAFSRGRNGFFAMISGANFSGELDTGLPPDDYCEELSNCDVILTVDENGKMQVDMRDDNNPFIAILTDAPENSYKRTVVLLEKHTVHGQYVFFRGGIDHSRRSGCNENPTAGNNCSVPIYLRNVEMPGGNSAAYQAWREGDRYLDWYGPEEGQGAFSDWQAYGTPGVWTTNDPSDYRYSPMNTYGEHYWLLDMEVDCSKTENGYFELKATLDGVWEQDIAGQQCAGAGPAPFTSINHVAVCGQVNVFHWNEARCEVETL